MTQNEYAILKLKELHLRYDKKWKKWLKKKNIIVRAYIILIIIRSSLEVIPEEDFYNN